MILLSTNDGKYSSYFFADKNAYSMENSSKQNFLNYGMNTTTSLDGVFISKKYVLQDTVSENEDGLWTTQLNRKPLSIKIEE